MSQSALSALSVSNNHDDHVYQRHQGPVPIPLSAFPHLDLARFTSMFHQLFQKYTKSVVKGFCSFLSI